MAESAHRVFISFVHEDVEVARAVQSLLTRELGLDGSVFLSSDGQVILAGDLWLQKIQGALSAARVVVLLLSKRAISRPWVNFEAGGAWLAEKVIIPCCFGALTTAQLPQPYSGLQGVNLPRDAYYLLRSVHTHLRLDSQPPQGPLLKEVLKMLDPPSDNPIQAAVLEQVHELTDPYTGLAKAIAGFEDVR